MNLGKLHIWGKMKIDAYLIPYSKKINFRRIKNLNVKSKLLRLSKENVGDYLSHFGVRK